MDANISVAGLALALTLPDVLGQKLYPGMVFEDGNRKVRGQYMRWFNSFVASSFGIDDCWFDGEMCYELRCSLLHAGNADIVANQRCTTSPRWRSWAGRRRSWSR